MVRMDMLPASPDDEHLEHPYVMVGTSAWLNLDALQGSDFRLSYALGGSLGVTATLPSPPAEWLATVYDPMAVAMNATVCSDGDGNSVFGSELYHRLYAADAMQLLVRAMHSLCESPAAIPFATLGSGSSSGNDTDVAYCADFAGTPEPWSSMLRNEPGPLSAAECAQAVTDPRLLMDAVLNTTLSSDVALSGKHGLQLDANGDRIGSFDIGTFDGVDLAVLYNVLFQLGDCSSEDGFAFVCATNDDGTCPDVDGVPATPILGAWCVCMLPCACDLLSDGCQSRHDSVAHVLPAFCLPSVPPLQPRQLSLRMSPRHRR